MSPLISHGQEVLVVVPPPQRRHPALQGAERCRRDCRRRPKEGPALHGPASASIMQAPIISVGHDRRPAHITNTTSRHDRRRHRQTPVMSRARTARGHQPPGPSWRGPPETAAAVEDAACVSAIRGSCGPRIWREIIRRSEMRLGLGFSRRVPPPAGPIDLRRWKAGDSGDGGDPCQSWGATCELDQAGDSLVKRRAMPAGEKHLG